MGEETWPTIEQPILEAIRRVEERGSWQVQLSTPFNVESLALEVNTPLHGPITIDNEKARSALHRLFEAGYITGTEMPKLTARGHLWDLWDIRLTEKGRQKVGQWPKPEPEIVHVEKEERNSRARKIGKWIAFWLGGVVLVVLTLGEKIADYLSRFLD